MVRRNVIRITSHSKVFTPDVYYDDTTETILIRLYGVTYYTPSFKQTNLIGDIFDWIEYYEE